MDFIIDTKEFAGLLKSVKPAHNSRSTMPVLANVLVTVEKGKLTMAATDLEMAIVADTVAIVQKSPGTTTIPFDILNKAVLAMDGDSIQVVSQQDENKVFLTSNALEKSEINSIPATEFPLLPDMSDFDTNSRELDAQFVVDNLSRTLPFVSAAADRPILTCVNVSAIEGKRKGKISFVSTDGYCLSVVSQKWPGPSFNINLPGNSAKAILSLAVDSVKAGAAIWLRVLAGSAVFRADNVTITTNTYEGNYPDISPVIPDLDNSVYVATSPAARLKSTVNFASVISGNFGSSQLTFFRDKADESYQVKVVNESDMGQHVETIPLVDFTGKGDFMIALNAKYVHGVAGLIAGDNVRMHMTTDTEPMVFTDPKDGSWTFILMPMHIGR